MYSGFMLIFQLQPKNSAPSVPVWEHNAVA